MWQIQRVSFFHVRFVFARVCVRAFMQTTHRVLCPGSGHQHNGRRGERRVRAGRGQQRKEMCKREKIEMKNTIWLRMWRGRPRESTREEPMFLLTWMWCWSSFTMHRLGLTPLLLRYIYQLHWMLSAMHVYVKCAVLCNIVTTCDSVRVIVPSLLCDVEDFRDHRSGPTWQFAETHTQRKEDKGLNNMSPLARVLLRPVLASGAVLFIIMPRQPGVARTSLQQRGAKMEDVRGSHDGTWGSWLYWSHPVPCSGVQPVLQQDRCREGHQG